ncbi:hypothetical protein RI844_14680 [Thalassotalea fonticola]|uniref:DUF2628 domain-containing protein n=1 Tax=Thalassotalea fonticola TaxID=3065649 RepID=A0ABZ0GM25_9GAMM|nr:hypothetical protein RI844_14680 [Colwelliaceae bacterium S1-1]
MSQEPYKTPDYNFELKGGFSNAKFKTYSDVPWFRRQWAFWLMYFTISPVALGILVFGDIYYVKKGTVVSFGLANRIVAVMFVVFILFSLFSPNS